MDPLGKDSTQRLPSSAHGTKHAPLVEVRSWSRPPLPPDPKRPKYLHRVGLLDGVALRYRV